MKKSTDVNYSWKIIWSIFKIIIIFCVLSVGNNLFENILLELAVLIYLRIEALELGLGTAHWDSFMALAEELVSIKKLVAGKSYNNYENDSWLSNLSVDEGIKKYKENSKDRKKAESIDGLYFLCAFAFTGLGLIYTCSVAIGILK
jgi:hypothetical protein